MRVDWVNFEVMFESAFVPSAFGHCPCAVREGRYSQLASSSLPLGLLAALRSALRFPSAVKCLVPGSIGMPVRSTGNQVKSGPLGPLAGGGRLKLHRRDTREGKNVTPIFSKDRSLFTPLFSKHQLF